MTTKARHKTIETELISSAEGHSDHQHNTLSDLLSKSMEQNNGKVSGMQDHPKTIESIDGVAIGHLVEGEASSGVWVDYPNNPTGGPLPAISTVAVGKEDIGREVALAFETGDPTKPILIGFIYKPQTTVDKNQADTTEAMDTADSVNIQLDCERLTLTADKEIVLCCGNASITLTRAGKILIRGTYLLNRSSGVNRIMGGSVQLN
jgi:hypothetical protein